MNWQVGQKVTCDRPDYASHCVVVSVEAEGVKVFCAEAGVLVIGRQSHLERLGWSKVNVKVPAAPIGS